MITMTLQDALNKARLMEESRDRWMIAASNVHNQLVFVCEILEKVRNLTRDQPCLNDSVVQQVRDACKMFPSANTASFAVERSKVSVHGTDGCMGCDEGRITVYAASRHCSECVEKRKGMPER